MDHTLRPGYGLLRTKGVVEHTGTYIGNDRVMHLGPPGLRIDSLKDFSAGMQVRFVPNDLPLYILQERIEKALALYTSYNAFWQNCEHLANYLQKGMRESPQLQGAAAGCLVGVGMARAVDANPWASLFLIGFTSWAGAQMARP